MGWIKTVGVLEMNYNVFEHIVGVDLIVTWHNAGLDLGGKEVLMVARSVCVEAQIYEFEYSKKYSEPREPR